MSITNNDILIRLRFALNLRDQQMLDIFKLSGLELTLEDVKQMLVKSNDESDEQNPCTNKMLDSFLNGLITYKRGSRSEGPSKPFLSITKNSNVNNVVLKKLKIALTLTSDDIIDIIEKSGVSISKGELSAVLRKEGERHYKECGDRYIRNFLKGLAIKYRNV